MPALYFMIALFGGLYYLLKLATEQGEKIRYENDVKKRRQIEAELKRKYEAPFEKRQMVENKILSGQYYDEICEKFKDDFQYALGWNWKEVLEIPPIVNKQRAPTNHIYWVYHLMLADEGLLDWQVLSPAFGLQCGGGSSLDSHIKFVKCIEKRLICRGVTDVRFVAKPNSAWAPSGVGPVPKPYTKRELAGCQFVIESLALITFPSYTDRIW